MNKTIDWSRTLQVTAFVIALLISTGAQQMHRWVDPQGNVHYSDQPPPADARDTRTISGSGTRSSDNSEESDDTDDETPSYVDREAEFQERQVMKAETEANDRKAEEEAVAKKLNCESARGQAQTLAAGGRITRRNAQGELEFLEDAEISEQLQQATKKVKQWCES